MVFGVSFYLKTESARIFIQQKINTMIPGSISWQQFKLSPFTGVIDFENFQLKGPDKKEIISLKKIQINFALLRLFAGEIFISSILLESPVVEIQMNNDGSVNVVSALTGQKGVPIKENTDSRSFPLNVIVDRLVLKDGSLQFSQPANEISAEINALEVQVRAFNLAQKVMNIDVAIKDSFFKHSKMFFDLDEFNASAALDNGTISPLSLSLISDVLNIGIKGSVIHIFDNPELAITLDSVMDLSKIAMLFQMEQNPEGLITLALSARGKLEDPAVDLSVKYGGGIIAGQKIDKAKFHFSLKDRLVKILPSLLESSFGNLSLNGTIDLYNAFPKGFLDQTKNFDTISYTLSMEQKGIEISKFLPEDIDIRGGFVSYLTLEGTGVDPEKLKANLTLDIDAMGLKQAALNRFIDVRIKTKAGMANKKIFLESMTVNTPGLVMKADGEFAPYSKEIKGLIHLNADDISPAAELVNIKSQGKVNLLTNISGSLDSPEILFDVILEKFELDRLAIGNISTIMDFSNGIVFIKEFELANKRSLFSAKGEVKIMEKGFSFINDPKFQLSLDASKIFLNDFVEQAKGELSLSATAKGTINDPSANITLVGKGMEMAGKILGNVNGKANFTRGVLNIDSFNVKNRQSALDIHGSLKILKPGTTTLLPLPDIDIAVQANTLYLEDFFNDMKGRFSVNGYIKGNPENLAGNLDVTGSMIDLGIQKIKGGELNLNLTGSGTLEDPFITGKLNLKDLSVNEGKINNIDLDFNAGDRVAQIKGNFGFRVDGEYHFEDRSFEADLDLNAVDITPYFRVAGQNDFSGNISGTVKTKGSIDQLDALSATADITNVSIQFKNNKFINIPGSNLSFKNGFLNVGKTDIQLLEKGLITISGQGGLKTDLAFTIDGDIPLEVIIPVAEDIDDATGNIKIAASIKGSVEKPMIKADVILEKLGMSLSAVEQKLQNINGHIQVSPEEILIKRFDGQLGDEKFDLKGNVLLSNFLPEKFDLDFTAHRLSLDFPDLMDISINSNLNLSGTNEKSELKGEIVLLEGRYYKDVKLNLANAAKRKRQHTPIKEKKEISFLKSISLNIDIKSREPFGVDNNLAFISISPDLNIYGTAENPLIGGRAQVDSGIITFRKNEFEVKKGIIDFVNPYKIEPSFDIEGEMEVRTWTVYLTVSGTPDNLDFKFHSKPDEQDVDILSLLAFGKTTRELRNSDGGSSFSAGEIFAGFVAETLQKEMKDASGMDYLEIKMNDTDDSGEQGVNVTVGKELSRYITVKYGVDVRNGETVQRVTTDYKILENFLMSGFQDTGGDFGGELKYRMEFR